MEQTNNYGLNQWDQQDRILREDFNVDNAKIEAAILAAVTAANAANDAATAAQNTAHVATGSYTGNGKSGRTVSFGVTPKMVHISAPRGRWKSVSTGWWSDYPIVLAQGCSDIATFLDEDVNYDATEETVTLSGSKVTVGKYFCNSKDITYKWVAIY